ncbi:MAG: ABC transporter permease [Nitrospinae bacterium]|nr:ABC transporter permease [Nitrospinota bacterium]
MLSYLFKRFLMMFPIMLGITLITFAVIHLAPGEPVDKMADLNPKISPQAKQKMREMYNLDKPLEVQYWLWLKRFARLDFGSSFSSDNRPVLGKILERLPITLFINVVSLLIIFLLSIPLGVMSATRQHSLFDKFSTLFVFVGFSTPGFWLSLLLMILFGVQLGWLPISGIRSIYFEELSAWGKFLDYSRHLVLPVLISSLTSLAFLSRITRQNMLEVIRQDYITTARAKGCDEHTVVFHHALRNALLPIVTIIGLSVPSLIGGSVIFETVFSIPGMGMLFYESVMSRDYPLVMGILIIGAGLTLIGNLLSDVGYALADPRIRYE